MNVPRGHVQSVDRALKLLSQFDESNSRLGITDLSQRLGLPKSTVHALAKTLESRGFLEKEPQTGKYRLGVSVYRLGLVYSANLEIRAAVQPWAERLSQKYEESVHLAIYAGGLAVFLLKQEPAKPFMVLPRLGTTAPAHATGVGKVLLAYLPDEELSKYLNNASLDAITANTITDPDRLRAELEEVRRRGYAVDNEEIVAGLACIAAPIRDYSGQVIAAMSLSGPVHKLLGTLHPQIVEDVKAAALSISCSMGYVATRSPRSLPAT